MGKKMWTAEALAKFFHETYEALAPHYGYRTRDETRVDWAEVPDNNKVLMVAVAGQVLDGMAEDGLFASDVTAEAFVDGGPDDGVAVEFEEAIEFDADLDLLDPLEPFPTSTSTPVHITINNYTNGPS